MEITRQLQPGYNASTDSATSATKVESTTLAKIDGAKLEGSTADAAPVHADTEPRLEQLQDAMRQLPDVDTDKVLAIRAALARGELAIDTATLAKLMASYHRGSDA
jgi:negative regulator of flagellin synthesis FlgM